MIRLHYNDIKVASQVCSILGVRSSRANHEASAVAVKHHRSLLIVSGRRPDIQEQAILSRLRLVRPGGLNGRRSQVQRISYTWPRLQFGRPTKAPVTRNAASIGDSFEDRDTVVSGTA
jgi:hypothetical protein